MATRNIVPRATGEGSLGASAKRWGNIYADNGTIAGRNIANDGAMLTTHEAEITNLQSQVTTLEHAYAGAKAAATVADMTDHNQIYVYVGSETGYTNGNWYYWNGTAWTSGGVYNATALETDTTLTVSGAAADAFTVGREAVRATGQSITSSNKATICEGDMNKLPPNKMYAVATGAGLLNAPTTNSGFVITLTKDKAVYGAGTMQMYLDNYNNLYYRRWWPSILWGDWSIVIDENKLQNEAITATGTSITVDNKETICQGDINNLSVNKMYAVATGAGLLNVPTANSGLIYTISKDKGVYGAGTMQVYLDNYNNRYYRRWWPSVLWGKWTKEFTQDPIRVLAIGDSICEGWRNGNKGFVGDLGFDYVNAGVSGACLSTIRGAEKAPIVDELTSRTETNFDCVLMEGGINDIIYEAPLGTLSTIPVSSDAGATSLNKGTIAGALENLFYQCIKKYPNADRFFIITHKSRDYPYAPHSANVNYTQQDLHDLTVEVCKLYNVQVIDIYNESPINTYFSYYYTNETYDQPDTSNVIGWVNSDRIHPLSYGYLHGYIPLIKKALIATSAKYDA